MTDNLKVGMQINRPWGEMRVIHVSPEIVVKTIKVFAKARTSLQYHKDRTETWIHKSGEGLVLVGHLTHPNLKHPTISDFVISSFFINEVHSTLQLGRKCLHRLENISNKQELEIIEVWRRADMYSTLSESDIVRLADDFGRCD